MAQPRSYDVNSANRDREAEVARLRAQAQLGWEKEAAALERVGFRDGMSIVELGSGPGFVTELLLDRFPSSRVTSVELDAALVEDARRYLASYGDRATFVETSAEHTGIDGQTFDAALARYLFQHLPDPAAATAETHRLLRPGGVLAIVEVDDDLLAITDPPVPAMRTVMDGMSRLQEARGGNRHIGRKLAGLLRDAGFEAIQVDLVAKDSEAFGLDGFLRTFDPGMLVPLVQNGVLSEEEVDDVERQRASFLAAEHPYVMIGLILAAGRKPPGH
jgi:ubiquinone/menaquinone biosynthesis C-methylase UbiE